MSEGIPEIKKKVFYWQINTVYGIKYIRNQSYKRLTIFFVIKDCDNKKHKCIRFINKFKLLSSTSIRENLLSSSVKCYFNQTFRPTHCSFCARFSQDFGAL